MYKKELRSRVGRGQHTNLVNTMSTSPDGSLEINSSLYQISDLSSFVFTIEKDTSRILSSNFTPCFIVCIFIYIHDQFKQLNKILN